MSRIASKPPDKGSFPLDHFHECDEFATKYNTCLKKHELMPKRCRQFQTQYLKCRMENGLMDKEEMERLGFTEEISWESEEAEKKFLFEKIHNLKEKAKTNISTQNERRKPQKPDDPSEKQQI